MPAGFWRIFNRLNEQSLGLAMYNSHGKVPIFRMKPHMPTLVSAAVVLVLGLLVFHQGHLDPGDIPAHERSNLALVIAIIVAGLLFIVSTGRMWFKHLWHDRYR